MEAATSTEPIVSLSQLDFSKQYSYADYLTWKFEQTVELIKGRIMPMSGPNRRHQTISRQMQGTLFEYFKKNPCEFYNAPFDVRLYNRTKSVKANKDVYSVVQPDLCVICDPAKLDDAGCIGAPDLIVEILSPGNSRKEMSTKKALYEESGVREYWIVDPEHEHVARFMLQADDRYSPPVDFFNGDILDSAIFPDLKIDLKEVF